MLAHLDLPKKRTQLETAVVGFAMLLLLLLFLSMLATFARFVLYSTHFVLRWSGAVTEVEGFRLQ